MRAVLLVSVLASCLMSLPARAQSTDTTTELETEPRNWVNLRAGAQLTDMAGITDYCLEVMPFKFLSLESCGSGSGYTHEGEGQTDVAHFRTKLGPKPVQRGKVWVQPQVNLGFAELQVDKDESGFYFNDTGPNGVETAGPEVGASLKVLVPLKAGIELVGDVSANAAWMEHAPDLVEPQDKFQPSATVTVGVGF